MILPPGGVAYAYRTHTHMAHCNVCGSSRWCGLQCANAPVVHAPVAVVHSQPTVVHAPKSKNGEDRYSDAEKRRAYRREWMRKRRMNKSNGSHLTGPIA
jgi:hypothetical protein